jgi:hypothetical protein
MLPGTGLSSEERTDRERAAPALEGRGEGRSADGKPAWAPEEEEAARAAIEDADPRELARTSLMAEYASSTLERLVRADVAHPEALDEAALGRLIDKYSPVAWREAEQWARELDPSTIPLARPNPKLECTTKFEKFKCDASDVCNYKDDKGDVGCVVTNCDKGVCPACPKIFNLDALIVYGWCVYTCNRGETVVGTKIVLHLAATGKLQHCMKLETPVP